MKVIGFANKFYTLWDVTSTVVESKYSKDTLVTKFEWVDSKGNKYPIIVNKGSGACYVWRKSAKTGKMYKSYLGAEVSQAVCKELGITYISKKK